MGKPVEILFYVNIHSICIKYWLNIVRMPNNRLPSKSYKMLYDLHYKNKNNWISYVCFTLYRYGFGFVWENQGVCNTKRFFCEFRQQLIDCCLQDWYSAMASKDRLAGYLFTIKKAVLRKYYFGQIQTRCIPFKNKSSAICRKNTRHFYLSILRHQRIRNSFSVSMPKIQNAKRNVFAC